MVVWHFNASLAGKQLIMAGELFFGWRANTIGGQHLCDGRGLPELRRGEGLLNIFCIKSFEFTDDSIFILASTRFVSTIISHVSTDDF